MKSKIALLSAVNDSFLESYLTMMYSLYKHNSSFRLMDTIVIDTGLSHQSKINIRNNIKGVNIIRDNIKVNSGNISTPNRLLKSFSKLQAFDIKSHDYIVVIDCDMVIIKKWDIDFDSLPTHTISACKAHLLKQGEMNFFNGGFIIIPKSIDVSSDKLLSLLNKKTSGLAEQDILNLKFKDFNVLPKKYNVEKKLFSRFSRTCTVIHYVGAEKPWTSNSKNFNYEIWRTYNSEMKKTMKLL
jgi:lipopolysaccharide biosynthesis glycosyltransferase